MFTKALLLFALLAPPAYGQGFYVDAVNGEDSNSGTSPADAWKTISHAVANTGFTPTIHIAPGTYDQALGEDFPITVRSGLRLIGDGEREEQIVDGDGTASLFVLPEFPGFCDNPPDNLFENLWLRDGGRGIDGVTTPVFDDSYRLRLVDVLVTDMTVAGVDTKIRGFFICQEDSLLEVTLQNTRIEGCGKGARVDVDSVSGEFAEARLVVEDSEIVSNVGIGLDADFGLYAETISSITVRRSVVSRNGSYAIAGPLCSVRDCLIVANGSGASGGFACHVDESTIAFNGGSGVYGGGGFFPCDFTSSVGSSIVYGNGDDLSGDCFSVTGSDIGDGDFEGVSGNISADPLFVDPAMGDFRLMFGSPCVDTLGLGGHDGNLDGEKRGDMGVFELTPLELRGAASIGGQVELDVWGPDGGDSRVLWSRGPLLEPPLATPFGDFELDRASTRTLALVSSAPGPPAVHALSIPDDPTWIGQTLHFQALTGSALTNAVTTTIEP